MGGSQHGDHVHAFTRAASSIRLRRRSNLEVPAWRLFVKRARSTVIEWGRPNLRGADCDPASDPPIVGVGRTVWWARGRGDARHGLACQFQASLGFAALRCAV